MTEKAENKVETLPDLDDLLQCPVCYEIPTGQIFQCNEGHHVCGRCKMRLDVCPVCRAFFFGTRNYAMEELIASVRKLRAFKLGGKVTTGSPPAEATPVVPESNSEESASVHENANEDDDVASRTSSRAPISCKGLFRCLCCKQNTERLPIARLLNHLRYYHSPDLIEGRSENGGYLQAWQFPTLPGRIVTAVRIHDMGIFFLIIEVAYESVHAWLTMAASPWMAHEFTYSFTLSGNDREAIFSDSVWSVRSCEGSLKKRGHCLHVRGEDARALLFPTAMNGKLCVRRTPLELQPAGAQPRAVLRVANRSNAPAAASVAEVVAHDLEPFLQDLQHDVERLSRVFASLSYEANALRSEAEMRARLEDSEPTPAIATPPPPESTAAPVQQAANPDAPMTRGARRRIRQRLRQALGGSSPSEPSSVAASGDAARLAPAAAPSASRPAPYSFTPERPRPNGVPAASDVTRVAPNQNARPHTNQAVSSNQYARQTNQSVASNLNGRPQTNQSITSNQNARPQTNQAVVSNQNVRPQISQPIASSQNARPQINQVTNTVRASNSQNSATVSRANADHSLPARSNDCQNSGIPPRVVTQLAMNSVWAGRERMPPPPPSAATDQIELLGLTVSPPPTPLHTFGGPSQDRPTNGNARNKKKRRQRRYNV